MNKNFEIGQKYFDSYLNGEIITITKITDEKIIAGAENKKRIHSDSKKSHSFLEDSHFADNLIPIWDTVNVSA